MPPRGRPEGVTAVFLSYRREDSAAYAGRLYDRLAARFGATNVFMDVDDIRPGEDFVRAIERHVQASRAALVLIGGEWLTMCDAQGRRRLDDAEDFVRREIAAALTGDRLVIPVLVDGAAMPAEADLPADIRALARAQAVEISDSRFNSDAAALVERLIEAGIAPLEGTRPPRRRALAIAVLLLAAAGGGLYWWGSTARREATDAAALRGEWRAEVTYDWGARHREVFRFEWHAGQLTGSAGYLGRPRGLEAAALEGGRLSFSLRTTEIMGDETREARHRYLGELAGDEIRFVMQTEGGFSSHPPLRFVARRAP